jgi:dihydroorotase
MNPPLRSAEDVRRLKEAVCDGTIDVIASDHAPHGKHDKEVEFEFAAFGIIGLETSLSLSSMELVAANRFSWMELIHAMSTKPATILGLANKGTLREGADADVVIIDPQEQWVYTEDSVVSKSKNSPFLDWTLKGRVTDTLVGGTIVVRDRALIV